MDRLSYPCMTTGKIIALTVWTFVSTVLSLFLNTVSRFVIAFLPRNKVSFNFMTAVIVHSNFGVQENKVCHCFYFFPFYLPRHDGIGFHDLRFLMLSFEPAFSLFCLISFNNVIYSTKNKRITYVITLHFCHSVLLTHPNTICAFPNMPEDFTPLYISFSFPLAKIWFSSQGIAHMAFFLGIAQTQNVKPRRALCGSWAQKSFCPPFLIGKAPTSMVFPEFQKTGLNSCWSREE